MGQGTQRLPALLRLAGRMGVALLSAPLLAAAQSPLSLGPLALIALTPWLWASRRAGKWEALVTGALVGTSVGCLAAPWLPEALRTLGSSQRGAVTGLLVTAAWAKLPLFAAVGWLAQRLRERPAAEQIAGVGLAFGLGEWAIGGWRLGVPWALLGHSQLAVPGVAQLAVVGGVPLLSLWVAAVNQALVLAAAGSRPGLRLGAALAGAWAAAALLGLPVARAVRPAAAAGSEEIPLLLVQPDVSRLARWDSARQLEALEQVAAYTSRALAASGPGVRAIVWPENLLTSPLDTTPGLANALQGWVDRWQRPLISGLARSPLGPAARRYRSSVVWIDPEHGVRRAVDKAIAIPLLESGHAVFAGALLAPLFGRAVYWPKVEEAAPGGPLRGAFTLTPALCYEVLFPGVVARRRAPDSLALLNLADDSWVSGDAASRQLLDGARFRAIEQRLPLLRLAHGGLSAVVDAYGRTQLELPRGQWAHAVVRVAPSPPPSGAERALLLGVPLLSGLGIWGALARRGARPVRGAAVATIDSLEESS